MPRAIQYWIPVFFFAALFLLSTEAYAGGKEKLIDSLKNALSTQKDTARIPTLVKLSQTYYTVNKDSALRYGRMLLSIAEAAGDSDRICDAFVIVGTCYHHLGQNDSSLYYRRRALRFAHEANYPNGEANAANDIGLYKKERGDLDSAIFYILKSIDIREQNDIGKPLGTSYTNLGFIYYANGDTTRAMEAYRKADAIAAKYNDLRVRVAVLNNMAAVFDEMKMYDSALAYYAKVMPIADSLGDDEKRSMAMINIGVTYRNQGRLVESEKLLLEAIPIKAKIEDADGEAIGCMELARTYLELKDYSASEKYLTHADTIAQRLQQKEIIREIYLLYSDLYNATGRLAQALTYYKMYHAINEEISGAEKQQTIEELRTRFDTEKKERENVQLREQNRLSDEAVAEADRKMKILIGGLIGVMLILGLIVYAYRTKMKTNLLLEAKNEQISKQNNTLKELNKKLIESEDELTALNATKDQLFSIISHDLGNPVNAIVNYNTVLRNQKETMTKEEMAQSLDKVNLTLQPLQGFLDNLLHWSIQQRNGMVIRKEEVNAADVITEITNLYQASLLTKQITVKTEGPPSMIVQTDRNVLRLIMRNLLGNAIKFSPPGNTVTVKCRNENGRAIIEVSNRGNKIEPEKIAAILEGKPVNSGRGTFQEQGTGLGLSLVSQYLKAMGGKMEVESDEKQTMVRIISQARPV